jgi:hypothetical protein
MAKTKRGKSPIPFFAPCCTASVKKIPSQKYKNKVLRLDFEHLEKKTPLYSASAKLLKFREERPISRKNSEKKISTRKLGFRPAIRECAKAIVRRPEML